MQKENRENISSQQYISEIIGEEYKNWKMGDNIFITAPTGSGKSYFILHVFLEWVMNFKGRMLYLVNRKILEKQIIEELSLVEEELFKIYGFQNANLKNHIYVTTYQSFECKIKQDVFDCKKAMDEYTCIVCDECHYFYADSNFNTSTELSFYIIQKLFEKKLQIYISATPNKILELQRKYKKDQRRKPLDNINLPGFRDVEEYERSLKCYSAESNYDYIELSIFEDIYDLISIIKLNVKDTKEKWLIFVDKIDTGNDLQKKLIKRDENDDEKLESESCIINDEVVFLDSDFRKREDAKESIDEISTKKICDKRVVISTAVMDCGVSLIDLNLKNIVILADTEEEFIQMLGRKRKNNVDTKVKLYICKRNIEHFSKRKNNLQAITQYYNMKKEKLNLLFEPYYYLWNNRPMSCHFSDMVNLKGLLYNKFFSNYHQEILDDLLSDRMISKYLKKICYSVGGNLTLNTISIQRCYELKQFYEDMITRLERDSYAFVKQQIAWLGFSEEKSEVILKEMLTSDNEKHRKKIENAVKKVLNKPMDKMENLKWKDEVINSLSYFLKQDKDYKSNESSDLKKNDRPISPKTFMRCMQQAELPYAMKTEGKKDGHGTQYTIYEEQSELKE